MAEWNQALIIGNELEPVNEILRLVQDAQTIASRTLAASEQEFQLLSRTPWAEETESARRFYWLRWQRDALRSFINEQALVTENLRQETDNVWHEAELAAIEDEEDEVIVAETTDAATAA
jgi:hypothetical protein